MLIADPEKLSVYIAEELRPVVPVRTGALRDSIQSSPTGVLAIEYYPNAMGTAENKDKERRAINTGTVRYLQDIEDDINDLFR